MVDLVGLGDYLNARPGELSGGQQQRVALARTLAVAPSIVLMDEPLSNLDEALNMQLRKEIVRLHGDLGFTLVYVTHNRDEAEALGARIVFLRHGRIGQVFTPSPTARRAQAGSGVRARSARKDAREDRPRPCVA